MSKLDVILSINNLIAIFFNIRFSNFLFLFFYHLIDYLLMTIIIVIIKRGFGICKKLEYSEKYREEN